MKSLFQQCIDSVGKPVRIAIDGIGILRGKILEYDKRTSDLRFQEFGSGKGTTWQFERRSVVGLALLEEE